MRLLLWVLAAWVLVLAILFILGTNDSVMDRIDPQPNLTEETP